MSDLNLPQKNSEKDKSIKSERIVWIDLELTGLDVMKDHIIEVACIITDANLNIVAQGPHIIINQSSELLDSMDEWCLKQHTKSGLIEETKNSKISLEEAENTIFDFLHVNLQAGTSPLAGSSVYMDRLFLLKYMPKIHNFLHYRIIDVSTVKELCRRWNTDIYNKAPKKLLTHRALDDIKESINELKWYKENFMNISV